MLRFIKSMRLSPFAYLTMKISLEVLSETHHLAYDFVHLLL